MHCTLAVILLKQRLHITHLLYDVLNSSFQLITAQDQLLPLLVMDILGNFPGLPGGCISSIYFKKHN